VTALGKLVRTTTFKIVAVYLLVFAAIAGALILYLARHTQDLVVSQLTETVEAEVRSLNDQYRIGGAAGLQPLSRHHLRRRRARRQRHRRPHRRARQPRLE
jgi:hypothetical protein